MITVVTLAHVTLLAGEEESTRPSTNLELIQRLSGEVGDTLSVLVGEGDSVRLMMYPAESSWYVEGSVLQAMSKRGRIPTASPSAPYAIELGLEYVQVRYADVRRSGFFGSRVLDRTITVQYAAKVVDKRSGTIVLSKNIVRTVDDVVQASEIEDLENVRIPATHGSLPKEGFFSTLLEPFVTMGAIAVAVYLLFHVRS